MIVLATEVILVASKVSVPVGSRVFRVFLQTLLLRCSTGPQDLHQVVLNLFASIGPNSRLKLRFLGTFMVHCIHKFVAELLWAEDATFLRVGMVEARRLFSRTKSLHQVLLRVIAKCALLFGACDQMIICGRSKFSSSFLLALTVSG